MIVGAGRGGNLLAREIDSSENFSNSRVVCFIDDDPSKIGNYISKAKVYGGRDKIEEAAEKYKIDEIILAMPSITVEEKTKILDICRKTGRSLKILPLISNAIREKNGLSSSVREVAIEDLLERAPVKVNIDLIAEYIEGKTVMVTPRNKNVKFQKDKLIADGYTVFKDFFKNSK